MPVPPPHLESRPSARAGFARVEVCGHDFDLLPARAALWRAKRTLLVADLHLGKAETFQRSGVPMPSCAMMETLDRLGRIVVDTSAVRVIVLGDLLHAPAGSTSSMVQAVSAWRSRVGAHIQAISGNHDRHIERLAHDWNVELLGAFHVEDGLGFVHDPDSAFAARHEGFVWAGHVHPAVTLGQGGARMKLPCFVVGERSGILPAFSLFTGGASVGAPRGRRLFACADEEVIEL